MLAFKVWRNGKLLALAGAEDLSVLSAGISAVGPLGPKTWSIHAPARPPHIWLHVGGLTSRSKRSADEHPHWVHHLELTPGDKITVLVTKVGKADRMVGSTPALQKTPATDQFDINQKLAQRYTKLKKKLAAKRTKRAPKKVRRGPGSSKRQR